MRHSGWVNLRGLFDWYAYCRCGWEGKNHQVQSKAHKDLEDHIEEMKEMQWNA